MKARQLQKLSEQKAQATQKKQKIASVLLLLYNPDDVVMARKSKFDNTASLNFSVSLVLVLVSSHLISYTHTHTLRPM
jgi:hypothetical protein